MGEDSGGEQIPQSGDASSERDTLLIGWNNLIEEKGGSLQVTLLVGGILVTGHLISARDYLREIAKELRKVGAGVAADSYSESAAGVEAMQSVGGVTPDWDFVHLRNARFLTPGSQHFAPTSGGVTWRGRVSAIDGFCLGELRAASAG